MRVQDFYSLTETDALPWPQMVDLTFVEQTGSTNDDLKVFLLNNCLSKPIGRVALVQNAGRGTRGRSWRSTVGGLYFSLAVPFEQIASSLTLIPLSVGLGLVGALRGKGIHASLKWPNDLWIKDGKSGGILCELCKDCTDAKTLIIGVGLNLSGQNKLTTNGWPISGADEEGRLNTPRLRTELLAALVWGIFDALSKENESIIREWPSFDAFNNRTITFESERECLTGQVLGIDDNGRLLLRIGSETRAFSSGSISPYDDSFD